MEFLEEGRECSQSSYEMREVTKWPFAPTGVRRGSKYDDDDFEDDIMVRIMKTMMMFMRSGGR